MNFLTLPVGFLSMNARSKQNLNLLWLGATDLAQGSRLKLSDVHPDDLDNTFNGELPNKLIHNGDPENGILVQKIMLKTPGLKN